MPTPIVYEFETKTMQVPRGESSVLRELQNGGLTNAEAIIYLCLNHGSTWNSGVTRFTSVRRLSEFLSPGMSPSYVHKTVTSLNDKGWIKTIDDNNPAGNRYLLRHHLCDDADVPVDRDDKPLKFAVPMGPGGPLERCFEGDISWKAALGWISLKLRSNWKAYEDTAGQTEPATLLELSKRCRMKNAGFREVITELTEAGMLQRLTPKSQKSGIPVLSKAVPTTCPIRASDTAMNGWQARKLTQMAWYWW